MKAYRVKHPNGSWTQPIFNFKVVETTVHRRTQRIDGPVHLREYGEDWGPWISRGEGTDRALNKLADGDVGLRLDLWNEAQKGVTVRIVQVAPTSADTSGSPGVDLLVGFLNREFAGQWESWGIYVLKYISGSGGTYSDHAYVDHNAHPPWCGRAIDVHPHSMAIGDQIKASALSEPSIAARLRYVLWREPDHYDHLHWSFEDGGAPGSC